MFIPDPDFYPSPDPRSRIPDPKTSTEEKSEKKLVVIPPFYVATNSVADPDPGSSAFLTPGSGIHNRFFFPDPRSRISDPGSRIPNPYFLELSDNFWGKKFYNSLKTFFLCNKFYKNEIYYSFKVLKKNIFKEV